MDRPKLFVYDWKPKDYFKSISDIVDVNLSTEIPQTAKGFSGIVLHSLAFGQCKDAIREAKELNILLISQGANDELVESNKLLLEVNDLEYDNVYYIGSYGDLFSKIREIFG